MHCILSSVFNEDTMPVEINLFLRDLNVPAKMWILFNLAISFSHWILRCVHLVFLQRKCVKLVHLGNMWEDVSSSQYPSHARTRPVTIGCSARTGCFYYAQDATSHLRTSRPCAGTGTVGGCRPAEMQRVHRRGPGKSEYATPPRTRTTESMRWWAMWLYFWLIPFLF
jgi:hypothetical protein